MSQVWLSNMPVDEKMLSIQFPIVSQLSSRNQTFHQFLQEEQQLCAQ